MTPSSSPKKKPRARKLERDRAVTGEKKGSTRHVAAKKAAAATRVAPVKKRSAVAKKRIDDIEDSTTRSPKKRDASAPRSDSAPRTERPSRGKEVWNPSGKPQSKGGASPAGPRRRRDEDDRPSRGRSERDDRPTRSTDGRIDVDPRRKSASDTRPARYRDDAPARSRTDRADSRPARGRDEAPARAARSRDDRPTRSFDDRAPRARVDRDDRAPRTRDDRPARTRDDAPARPVRDRDSRASRDDRPARAPRVDRVYEDRPIRAPKSTRSSKPDVEEIIEEDTFDYSAPNAWRDLGISDELLPILMRAGIAKPFPIQAKTLPDAIAGNDILGRAQTGSGKTLAFGLAMLTRLAHRKGIANHPLGLVLVPTRELAAQVNDALMPFAQSVGLDLRLIAGGMPYAKQIDALRRGVHILVATPGRLNDLIAQGHVEMNKVEVTVLDEADQMCDMGFTPQITEILDLTKKGSQRLLFSATLDNDVDKIVKKYLHDPIEHATATKKASVSTMEHFLFVVYSEDKQAVIAEIASRSGKTMFFGRTQLGVDRISKDLAHAGVASGSLHGGKSQGLRTKTLKAFKDGVTDVLVATDVAARGIHVDGVTLVVHIDPPGDPKDYLHRAGRTARAGEEGKVVTLAGPRQQKSVLAMMQRAGVNPIVVQVRSLNKDMVRITGAKEPSGIPWHAPTEPPKRGGRPPARRGGKPSSPRARKW